jgi:anti-anti-sigma factor
MQWAVSSSTRGPVGQPAGDIGDDEREPFLAHLRDGIALAAAGESEFVVDLAGVVHISATALMALTIARKEAISSNVKIVLARPNPEIREVLEISRYQLIFDIFDDLELDGS